MRVFVVAVEKYTISIVRLITQPPVLNMLKGKIVMTFSNTLMADSRFIRLRSTWYGRLHAITPVLILTLANQAQAQNDPQFIILGPALTTEYQGSDEYEAVPMLISKARLFEIPIEIEGLTARAELFQHNHWKAGLTTELDFGRDSEVENTAVARMEEIDSALNAGIYLSREVPDLLLNDDALEFRMALFHDLSNAHQGAYGTLSASYELPLILPFKVEFELETTYANEDYMNTYFGVNPTDAAQSGFEDYQASHSFRDISFNTNIGIFTSPNWGGFVRLGVSQLLADAEDSPIVKAGDSTQYFVGLGVFYRLGD